MLFKTQRRSHVGFALAAVLACYVIRPALAENVADGAFPTCASTKTETETQYVTTTTTVYSLAPASETLSTGTTESESTSTSFVSATTEPASSTREVITVTSVPPAVESTVYVDCTSGATTSTPVITSTTTTAGTSSTTAKPPTPTPPGCVYPSKNNACAPLIKPRNYDVYAGLLDGCSIVPKRNTSTKWTGVARAYYNHTNNVFRLDIEYAPALVNVTGVTIARGQNNTMAPKLLRLKFSTPRWKPLIYPTSLTISTAPVRLSPAAADALISGNLYVTVNTARRPVGAIRGQLYCAGPECTMGSLPIPLYPKFNPTSCNPKNQYGKALTRQKCFACI